MDRKVGRIELHENGELHGIIDNVNVREGLALVLRDNLAEGLRIGAVLMPAIPREFRADPTEPAGHQADDSSAVPTQRSNEEG